MVDYDYNLSFIGNNFTNESVVKVTLSLTDNNNDNVTNQKVYLTSENGEILTNNTNSEGLVEFNVTRTGKWTASTDLTGCNTTYRTITVNHTLEGLYDGIMGLINQQFHTKSEYDGLFNVHDITEEFNTYLTEVLEYSLVEISSDGYTETVSELGNVLSDFLESEYNSSVPLSMGVRFCFSSSFCDGKFFYGIINTINNNGVGVVLVYNPEYEVLIMEDMLL